MANGASADLLLSNLAVQGSTAVQTLTAGARPVVPQGISVVGTRTYAIPPSIANNSSVIFQAPVLPGATCFLPPGNSVPLGFYLRVMNMDAGAATVVVLPSGQDKIIKRFPNPAYGSAATSIAVQATGASVFRWLGDFWFSAF